MRTVGKPTSEFMIDEIVSLTLDLEDVKIIDRGIDHSIDKSVAEKDMIRDLREISSTS